MALIETLLAAQLTASYANTANNPFQAAQDLALAVSAFWMTGIGPGGAVVVAVQSTPLMMGPLTGAFAAHAPTPVVAQKVAKAIDNGFKIVLLVGGVYGGHIMMRTAGPGGLAAELTNVWQSPGSVPFLKARKVAKAIKNFTVQGTAYGTGIPPAVPPQVGPVT